ncbi:LOW QUALITY PROTEIN: putative 2-hydroxyacid dehydrogenase SERP1888 [Erethizon dorsatum]
MHSQPQGKGREGGHICRWEQEGFHTRETASGDPALPGVLVSALEGPRGVREDLVGELQKSFTLITMKEFLENKIQWDRELLLGFPSLKLIASSGVGLDHLDRLLIANGRAKVADTPHAVPSPTAVLGMVLLLASPRVVEGYQLAVLPDTVHFPINWVGQEVSRASLGVVGMGTIGYKIAQRDKAFDMKIPYYNRNCSSAPPDSQASLCLECPHLKPPQRAGGGRSLGATFCERLDDLLQQSDFVTLALMPQTQAGAAVMKLSAILVNIGRGTVCLEAIRSDRSFAFWGHVTHLEPLPRDHPLLKLNIILTLHIGNSTQQARQVMENLVESILASFNGLPTSNEVLLE